MTQELETAAEPEAPISPDEAQADKIAQEVAFFKIIDLTALAEIFSYWSNRWLASSTAPLFQIASSVRRTRAS